MADVHSKKTRSFNMSQIRSTNTKPELVVRRFLSSKGFRYRLHDKKLPGKPDIVSKKLKTVIFVHGCFWHGHEDCKYYVVPKTRTEWWLNKIERNILNDKVKKLALKREKWRVITIWECELKKDKIDKTLQKLLKQLQK